MILKVCDTCDNGDTKTSNMSRNVLITESDTHKEKAEERALFSSKIGLICSCLGCVVGTGNIWRFPRVVARNSDEEGGLVFLIVWIAFLFLWSAPILLIEYGTGRYTKKAVVGSFKELVGEGSAWCGAWISMVSFIISCYYSVVLGWCYYYVYYYIAHELPISSEESTGVFYDFADTSYWPVLTHGLSCVISGLAVWNGVKTIEKVNLFLVPVLLLIILFTFIWSLTREYADAGIKFLFSPSWESLKDPRVWVDAVSQNAFDTGAGAGVMLSYATFMSVDNGIVKYGMLIPATNNLVSLICGIMVFSIVFSTLITTRPSITKGGIINIMKESGPASTGLTFIWIPVLFETIGGFGRVLCILFFVCLSFAGTSSLIANVELVTHTLCDFGMPRKGAMFLCILGLFALGLPSAMDLDILTNQDFVWGFALVINGMMLQYMVIRYGTRKFRDRAFNSYSIGDWPLPRIWEWIVKFVAPLEALVIIGWWMYDLIDQESVDGEEKWYDFGKETLVMTLVQWAGLMVLVVSCNILVLFCRKVMKNEETVVLIKHEILTNSREDSKEYASIRSIEKKSSTKEVKL